MRFSRNHVQSWIIPLRKESNLTCLSLLKFELSIQRYHPDSVHDRLLRRIPISLIYSSIHRHWLFVHTAYSLFLNFSSVIKRYSDVYTPHAVGYRQQNCGVPQTYIFNEL